MLRGTGKAGDRLILLRRERQSISRFDIMANNVLKHLFTGFVRLHILYHADKQPVCGVELMEELQHHGYSIGPGTLYPVLHGLEEAGFVKAKDEVVGGKRRKNFRTTARGRKLLVEARGKLIELASEIVDDQDEMTERRKHSQKHAEIAGEGELSRSAG
ncbi:MAG TPA: PadR family transcriptional regulator, partial [Pirellulaceae bacterium]|nr:PadR family transcriptional regulator [Pirellulaceae bacterium]